jgi:cell division protein FtsL
MNRKKQQASKAPFHARTGGFWLLILLFFFVELFFYTWCRVQYTHLSYEIADAVKVHQQLLLEQTQLKIELERLKSPKRIERIAREKFGLTSPTSQQIVILP